MTDAATVRSAAASGGSSSTGSVITGSGRLAPWHKHNTIFVINPSKVGRGGHDPGGEGERGGRGGEEAGDCTWFLMLLSKPCVRDMGVRGGAGTAAKVG